VFRCAAAVGALAAEAPRHQVRALGEYGGELGLAFQIIDDLLDYTGEEARLGKRPGTDLRAGTVTLPLLRLRDRLRGAELARLSRSLGDIGALPWVVEKLHEHDVPAYCRARAGEHVARATRAVSGLPSSRGRLVLAALTEQLVSRRC
jgi:octaprenyl-diphosphate synthase